MSNDETPSPPTLDRDASDRLAGLIANLILVLKNSDRGQANWRLQLQAAINKQGADTAQILGVMLRPEVLAAVAPQDVIDRARQLKRRGLQAVGAVDETPVKIPVHRDEDITLVGIPLPGGKSMAIRTNRATVKTVFTLLGSGVGWLAHHFGHLWWHW